MLGLCIEPVLLWVVTVERAFILYYTIYTISHALAAPSVAPQNIQVNTVSSTQLEVQWEPPPVETQNGIIQGYKVITSPRSLLFFKLHLFF